MLWPMRVLSKLDTSGRQNVKDAFASFVLQATIRNSIDDFFVSLENIVSHHGQLVLPIAVDKFYCHSFPYFSHVCTDFTNQGEIIRAIQSVVHSLCRKSQTE